MVYLKGTLAGIAGSILALILLVIAMVAINTLNRPTARMVGINVVGPIPISVAALGFILGFYFFFRR
jgi:ABC-type lipoprotein release transport system permease subunit